MSDAEPGPRLPIEDVVPALTAALALGCNAVLVAPPGAGKTTRAPLALLGEDWVGNGRIIVLEPRRLAARAAAARMAHTLGESVGDTVGLRVRMESRVGPDTRLEGIEVHAARVRMGERLAAGVGTGLSAKVAPLTAAAVPAPAIRPSEIATYA